MFDRQSLNAHWSASLSPYLLRAQTVRPIPVEGKLSQMVGLTLRAVGCTAAVGDRCRVLRPGGSSIEAEVVGFDAERTLLMPIGDVRGLAPEAPVIPSGRSGSFAVGDGLLGRVLDGTGTPMDGLGDLVDVERKSMVARSVNPLQRRPVDTSLDVGVRAINSLITIGEGQRVGLFAGSGVGKSMLLGMMTKFTEADVVVVGLIGERGREVGDFVRNILGEEGMRRSVVVAAPADAPPLVRSNGAQLATSIAEHYRDEGKRVLLLMDSLTRFAQAQREVALAVGEPPATRGYPPSVFARLPQLVERAGNGRVQTSGSITAIYTVLVEGDDTNDPIADASRAILDGHIVLGRRLAEQGHFPAIDVEASVSRTMIDVARDEHLQLAREFRELYATYQQNQDLLALGAYASGSDPVLDRAIALRSRMQSFLRQPHDKAETMAASVDALAMTLRSELVAA
jgi:flagellum-specific ATP synthase